MTSLAEQRNPYKGTPPRAWVQLRFRAPDGTEHPFEFLADTGSPHAVILGMTAFNRLKRRGARQRKSNFGRLKGGYLRLAMPDFALTQTIVGYGSDAVLNAVQKSHPNYDGLVGLPLLRLVEYGGDSNSFWIRPPLGTP